MATLCRRGWLLAETIGDLQSAMSKLLFACSKRLVESRGSTNHSGRTAMDTAFHRGWLVCEQRVQCGNFFFSIVLLETVLLCEALLPDPAVSIGQFHSKLRLSFAPCICVFSIVRCVHNMFCCGKLCALVL